MASNEMKGYFTKADLFVDLWNSLNQEKTLEWFAHYFLIYSWAKWKGAIVFSKGGFKQSVYSHFAMLSEILDIFSILAW